MVKIQKKNRAFNIFKIEYTWYEGEHEKTFLGKDVEQKEFEKDLIKAKEFAESLIGKKIEDGNYLGKGYAVECLPEYYEQIVGFLINNLGYIKCYIDKEITYMVDDPSDKKISLIRLEEQIKHHELKNGKKNK